MEKAQEIYDAVVRHSNVAKQQKDTTKEELEKYGIFSPKESIQEGI